MTGFFVKYKKQLILLKMAKLTELAQQKYQNLILGSSTVANLSELILHTLYPNQFELYFVALELQNSKNPPVVTDRFIFPILPTSITNPDSNIASVQKTAGGIVTNYVSGFVPNQIIISGHFGRDFKTQIMNRENFTEFTMSEKIKEQWAIIKPFLSNTILNGYGCFNALKRIFEKSRNLDESGKPYKVIFHNFVYSSSYYVQLMNLDSNMTYEKNRIHTYTLTMTKTGTLDLTKSDQYGLRMSGGIQNSLIASMKDIQNTTINLNIYK